MDEARSQAEEMIAAGVNPFSSATSIRSLINSLLGCGAALAVNAIGTEQAAIQVAMAVADPELDKIADLAEEQANVILARQL